MQNIDLLPTFELSNRQKNYTGQRKGKLTYIKPSHKSGGRTYWWMQCDCGNIEAYRSDHPSQECHKCAAISKKAKLKNKGMVDLTGQQFGYLTALYPLDERKNEKIIWYCKCSCGVEIEVPAGSLTSGNTKSCGCLKKQTSNFVKLKSNLIGKRFGHLTVIEETSERQYGKIIWKCACDCGNVVKLNTSRLTNGNDISCGCQKTSLGALNLKNILDQNNINYIKEYTEQCLQGKRFDFAVVENEKVIRLIEYDGEQHFRSSGGWNNEETFQQRKAYDKIKNEYALSHNIPLVRIPYWERDNITLEMIMGPQYEVRDLGQPTV